MEFSSIFFGVKGMSNAPFTLEQGVPVSEAVKVERIFNRQKTLFPI